MAGYAQNMLNMRSESSDLFNQILQQAMGLQSGKIAPWELPQFGQYQQLYQNNMENLMKNLYANMSARGMNPGMAMNMLGEQGIKGLNQAMMNLFTNAYGGLQNTATQGLNNWNQLAKLWLDKRQQDQQMDMFNKQLTQSYLTKGASALAGGLSGLPLGGGGTPGIDWGQAYGMNLSEAPITHGYT